MNIIKYFNYVDHPFVYDKKGSADQELQAVIHMVAKSAVSLTRLVAQHCTCSNK